MRSMWSQLSVIYDIYKINEICIIYEIYEINQCDL